MRTIERYDDNKMLELVLPELRNYIQNCGVYKISPTKKEGYLIDIALNASNITECIDQIYFSIEMLSGYRKRKDLVMTRHDYIVFMIENFYLRLTSIFDRTLQLTNLVFDIGIPERECRESTVIQNSKVKGTPVATNLKKINNIIGQYRKIRNQIAHSESFNEKGLVDIQGFYLMNDTPELERFKLFFKRKTDDYVKGKKIELKKITQELEKMVMELFESMRPFIENKANTLS